MLFQTSWSFSRSPENAPLWLSINVKQPAGRRNAVADSEPTEKKAPAYVVQVSLDPLALVGQSPHLLVQTRRDSSRCQTIAYRTE